MRIASGESDAVSRAVLFGIELEEVRGQQRNVLAARAQRRQFKADDVQPVEEVFAEAAFAHSLLQVDVGRGDDADVDLDLLHAAEMHEAAVLQDAQDLRLHVHAHGADLVEEERAAVGDFEEAFLCRDRGGEGAFDVAEERGFQQIRRHCAGVDRNERPVAARRVGVDGLGDELLAGAALALDQNSRAAGRDLRDEVEEAQHRLALADDIFEVVALLERALELDDLFFGAMPGDRRRECRRAASRCPTASGRSSPRPHEWHRRRCRRCRTR